MPNTSLPKPYKAANSGIALSDALERNRRSCRVAAQNFYLNDLAYYRLALEMFLNIDGLETRAMDCFMDPVDKKDGIILGIRHDVDHDIIAAREISKIEAKYGVRSSYYILHSHPFVSPGYYGSYDHENELFLRHECLAEIYNEIQANGCEIGLHVDATRFYSHGIDGQAAVASELVWLRSQGLNICGIAAHNSAQADGCENFEYFDRFHLNYNEAISFNGYDVALGKLSTRDLGITYEANYARKASPHAHVAPQTQNPGIADILRAYLHENTYCEWGADIICWLYSKDCWAISEKRSKWNPSACLYDVVKIISSARGKRALLHVHPFYCDAF